MHQKHTCRENLVKYTSCVGERSWVKWHLIAMLCFPLCLQTSLTSLMTTLGQSHPYFVRCVKPNEKKVKSFNI